ncbi:MAG TPA: ABC transporter substrate-binding protein [Actinomycetota bacterium]|nr:ABC transporter substrate-binding protein [Actinomycetota bacterium]
MRRTLRVGAAVAVLAVMVAACKSNSSTAGGSGAPNSSATIVHGTTDSIVSLDPAGQYDLGSQQISGEIYDNLLVIPAGGNTPEASAAQSCAYSDPKTYTCTLKPGLKFSDGSPLTSEDVAFSFKRNLEINDPNGACSLLNAINKPGADGCKWNPASIDTPDDATITFHLNAPDATWPMILTSSAAYIVPSDVFPETKLQPDDKVIGSGHYTLTKYTPGQQVVLAPNPNWWGDPPANGGVIVQYFDKSSALKLALEQGDVDVGWRTFTPTDVEGMKGESQLQVLTGPGSEIRYLVFNESFPAGKELAVRQAVAMTVDRQAIVHNVYNDTVAPLWSMVPSALPGHIDAFKDAYGDSPDVAGAKKALQDAGISTPVPLEIWWTPTHYGDSSADEYAEIKRSLESSGLFTVTLKSTEWDTYINAAVTDQYPNYQLGWFPDYPDPDNYVFTFYSSASFLNDHYKNAKVDQLLADERASTDQAQRVKDFQEIQKIGAQDVPIVPIWEGRQLAVTTQGITGVQDTLDVAYLLRYWMIGKSS